MNTGKANLFLCSAPRSGSTQLAAWLDTHPEIALSPIKEPNYFAAQDFDENYVRRIHLNDVEPRKYVDSKSTKPYQFAIFREAAHYDYLFSGLSARWRLDASTTYLQSDDAPQKIFSYNPEAIVVVLTRHPLERAVSHYRLAHRTGRTRKTLSEQIATELHGSIENEAKFLLRLSKYKAALARYRTTFPAENLIEIRFEEVIANPHAALATLAERLSIDIDHLDLGREKRNAGDAPIFPKLNAWAMSSGFKPLVGRILSPEMKDSLRKFLFHKGGTDKIQEKDRAALADALADEIAAYEAAGA
ncbi:hypothetical protein P775_02700 [Puniceibacterium antarcticum]|uniref:Sulfotransferase domain-containing protein n=1 Tax=Puniceibacterium antarcticum TaxID=1206336 RepID=A0A2G8RJI4_9RHOB|nr:sulfotransferase [Puniceibacterium antarcticum]PIL21766.1 hypothetical protein P775_02700 [Puniceibacterium antarcticum]